MINFYRNCLLISIACVIFIACFVTQCHAAEQDKVYHAFVGAASAVPMVMYIDMNHPDMDWWLKPLIASIPAAVLGLGKELYDSRKGGSGFDNKDLMATWLGGVGGASIMFTVTWTW